MQRLGDIDIQRGDGDSAGPFVCEGESDDGRCGRQGDGGGEEVCVVGGVGIGGGLGGVGGVGGGVFDMGEEREERLREKVLVLTAIKDTVLANACIGRPLSAIMSAFPSSTNRPKGAMISHEATKLSPSRNWQVNTPRAHS